MGRLDFLYASLFVLTALGCATPELPKPEVEATVHRTAEYESLRFAVRRHQKDEHRVDQDIENELRRYGMQVVDAGAYADVDVDYVDRWMWDMTMYLLSLEITFTDARTGDSLAAGKSRRVSLVRAAPGVMAREIIKQILRMNAGLAAKSEPPQDPEAASRGDSADH